MTLLMELLVDCFLSAAIQSVTLSSPGRADRELGAASCSRAQNLAAVVVANDGRG